MAVHLPLSVEAQAEARVLMLASNNILKPSDGRPVAVPTQDMIIGLYHLTGEKDGAIGEGMAFGSISEAILAHDMLNKTTKTGLDLQAKIRIRMNGELKTTTLGKALFNDALPGAYQYVDKQVGKKEIEEIIVDLVERFPRTEVAQTLDRVKDAGFHWATRSGVSMAISDVNFDTIGTFDKERARIISQAEREHSKIQAKFDMGGYSEDDRYDAFVELWDTCTREIETLLKASLPEDNAIYKMVTSKARGNWIQIRSIMGMRGPVAKSNGVFADIPVKGNYLIGLSANEYFVNSVGARKGNADTAMKTAAAGYLTRRLVDVAQDVIIRIDDCGTSRGIEKFTKKAKTEVLSAGSSAMYGAGVVEWDDSSLALSIIHRTLAEDITAGKTVIAKAGDSIDQHVIAAIKANDVESVKVRTVLTCQAETGLCAKCYGVSLATGNAVELGEAVGIIAAQSIGEPGTQLTMRTFHTGGSSGKTGTKQVKVRINGQEKITTRKINSDITTGLTGVTDMLEARMSKGDDIGIIAFWSGVLNISETVNKSGATQYEVRITPESDAAMKEARETAKNYQFSRTASKTFKKLDPELPVAVLDSLEIKEGEGWVPALRFKQGDFVARGEVLSNGKGLKFIPQEVLATGSINKAAASIINGVQLIYGAQDVALHDKHLEVIVRQMLSKVTIVDSGETDLMPGAQMDRRTYMRINKEARDEGKKTASARDEVLGMTRASLAAESWLSAASFQETTRVLTQAALDRSTDKLKGLKENVIIGKLIPAGTGLAAYRQIDAVPTEEAKAERYPNIPWATTSDESIDFKDDSFSGAGLSFTSLEDYSNEEPAQ